MVQFSNSMTSVINPMTLAEDRTKNFICPKLVMDDLQLTLTLKSVEMRLFNLCLELNSYKLLTDDISLAELLGRKPRTARAYISKLVKLGKLKKLSSKEKGKYYLAFIYDENLKLNAHQFFTIDEQFNVTEGSHPGQQAFTTFALDEASNPDNIATRNNFDNIETKEHQITQPISQSVADTVISNNALSKLELELDEIESLYSQLSEDQQDLLLPIFETMETLWTKNGKLSQLKATWSNQENRNKTCKTSWENFLSEEILLEIKKAYAAQLKEILIENDCDEEEAKNTAIFALLDSYELEQEQFSDITEQQEQVKILESVEVLEATQAVLSVEYLPQAVGESHAIAFSSSSIANNNSPSLPLNSNLANSCQNKKAQNYQQLSHQNNLANSCQKENLPSAYEETRLSVQEQIGQRREHMFKVFVRNENQNQKFATSTSDFKLVRPQTFDPVKSLLNNELNPIAKAILANVELANSCQNKLENNQSSQSLKSQTVTNTQTQQEPTLVESVENTNDFENLGNNLPNSEMLPNLGRDSLVPTAPGRGATAPAPAPAPVPVPVPTPTATKSKRPVMKNYFWNIE